MQKVIEEALAAALKAGEKRRVSTLRLIRAAIKDREIALRGERGGEQRPLEEHEILAILDKMVRQREESAKEYRRGQREDLAQQEEEEIAIIAPFMPKKMDEEEALKACQEMIGEIGASGIRDMGKVINLLKQRYPGQMDMGHMSRMVRDLLTRAA